METQAHVPEEVKTLPAEHKGTVAGAKPHRSFWQIWNMCFGFLGLQFGFALQNANVSRIFQTLGAGLEQVPLARGGLSAAAHAGARSHPPAGRCAPGRRALRPPRRETAACCMPPPRGSAALQECAAGP